MTTTREARNSVRTLVDSIGELKGWRIYDDVATGASPPWIVIGLTETGRLTAEDTHATSHTGRLDIRVVARTAESIDIVMDRLKATLDGARPKAPGMGRLMPDRDSGIYASELTDTTTSAPFLLRVLSWRLGWSA